MYLEYCGSWGAPKQLIVLWQSLSQIKHIFALVLYVAASIFKQMKKKIEPF